MIVTDWHPEDIKAELRKRGITLTALALRAGVSKQVVTIALRKRASAHCERVIAEALGQKPHKIWPSRYRSDGSRVFLRPLSPRELAAA
ncbi:helix-turn-helix domain-containing protein [Sphingomonas sp. CCH15-F11]|uniref:helix-turn-helix domain-containing protein n=1 Tax=Sphingomonas sp. CCH15-F11 TaxID=1768785 RepID=UPI0009E7B328|nr:helix-turn-helix domain-containing protein [Sphingomonas sp. CCH15-F11]